MRLNGNELHSMKTDAAQRESMEIRELQRKSMQTNGKLMGVNAQ